MARIAAAERKRLGAYLLLPGLALLIIGGYFAFRELRFRLVALPATGKYTDEGGTPVAENKVVFTYYITFQAKEGGSYQFVESGVQNQLPEGKELSVLYDPFDPQNARLPSRDGWYLPRSLGPAGLLFTILGVVLIRSRRAPISPSPSPAKA